MSVHKDKKRNTWYVKYNNKTKRGFVSKKEAKNYEIALKAGTIRQQTKIEKYQFSFIARDFLSYKKNELAYTSYTLYEYIVENNILPFFEGRNIEDIDELDCKRFKEYVNKLSYSVKRKNRIIHMLKNIFLYAVDYYGLTSNPSIIIKVFNCRYEETINRKKKEFNIWNDEEFSKFISCVSDERYRALFITLYLTGMRLGEALALTFDDISQNKISITKSQTKKCENATYGIKTPKNVSSIRDISINDSLYHYLMSIKEKQELIPGFTNSWFVFWGKEPLCRTSIERIKNKSAKKANVKQIRLHDLRHSHASNLIGEGMDIVAVSKRLGHSNVEMTLKVYTHLLKKNDEKMIDYLEKSSHNLLTDE